MRRVFFRFIWFAFGVGLILTACGPAAPALYATPTALAAPTALATFTVPIATGFPVALPTVLPTALPAAQPAILEARTLTLEWPPVMRAGDADVVRLTLEVDERDNITPTAEYEGHVTTGQTVYIPNVYATHNVVAEARLDLAGVQAVPAEMASQALRPGQRVTFYWSIRPAEVGRYRGAVWFYLRFEPLDGGPESERAIAALPIEIEVVSLLGLKAGPARILGVVGALISSVLGIPFLEDALRWLWRRAGKRGS